MNKQSGETLTQIVSKEEWIAQHEVQLWCLYATHFYGVPFQDFVEYKYKKYKNGYKL